MRETSRLFVGAALVVAACGTADNRVDPADLELRDVLGIAPDVAASWDSEQRAAARRAIAAGLAGSGAAASATVPAGAIDDQLAHGLAMIDGDRFARGEPALGLVRIELSGAALNATAARGTAATAAYGAPDHGAHGDLGGLALAERWDSEPAWSHLPERGLDVLAALATDGGHLDGSFVVSPAPRLPAIAGYLAANSDGAPARLVVNPVALAALDPVEVAALTTIARTSEAVPTNTPPHITPPASGGNGLGNPYSFYGSVEECAAALSARCAACLPASTCTPITDITDGNSECTMLAASDGRGFFLECINMALAISGVSSCAAKDAPSCARNTDAASSLANLEANADFLDDATCAGGLDSCLAQIYGAPSTTFPTLVDGGSAPPTTPPRSTDVSCGDSCNSSKDSNCQASPSCNCSGPSCNNSLSCDSACSSSDHQSGGCGDSCSSSGGGGGTSSGGGCNDSCGGGSSSSSTSNSGCGSCGGSGSGGGCGGGSGGCGNGGGSGCSVAAQDPSAGAALIVSIAWAMMPIPIAAFARRRARKKQRRAEGTDADAAAAAEGEVRS